MIQLLVSFKYYYGKMLNISWSRCQVIRSARHHSIWIFYTFRTILVNTIQITKYQYTILDLLQERIIFLHLKQFLIWSF